MTSQVLEFFQSFGELHFLPSIFCQPSFAVVCFGSAKPAGSAIAWRHRREFWQKMDGEKYAMEEAMAKPTNGDRETVRRRDFCNRLPSFKFPNCCSLEFGIRHLKF